MPMEGSENREHFCEFMFERENDVVSFEPSGSSGSLVQPLVQTVQSWFNPSTVQRVTPDRKANWFNHRFKQCIWMCMLECISESG